MKLLAVAIFLSGIALVAQQRSGGASNAGGFGRMINPGGAPPGQGGGGFGRLVYPGTGGPVAARPGRPGGFVAPPRVAHQDHNGAVIVPYPVFYGGYYYGYDAPPAPNTGGYYYDPSTGTRQDPPVVIINQNFAPDTVNPSYQDYSNVQLPPATLRRHDLPSSDNGTAAQAAPPDDQPNVYLIALKDHTIFAAIGYWIEGDTINYITQDNVHNRISLSVVDRPFTKQLNDERHIELRLPPEQ